MLQRVLFLFFLLPALFFNRVSASERNYQATRTSNFIKIDGKLNEAAWATAEVAGNFVQNEPNFGAPVSQRTEVRIVYDNALIYIGAMLYDSSPDSILHQLGNRDEVMDINADGFRIGLDPYNKRIDGYVFDISASGVQAESYKEDQSFDAVWESVTAITDSGWIAELRIPYSAIRFPDATEQVWAVQFARLIRRNREYDQWSPVRRDLRNPLVDWGTMTGISNVNPPLRLSLTPYVSFYLENTPTYANGNVDGYETSYSYSGGADIKLGINESFTLDMTLLPDFSQVQSDNKIKNLTAFEQIFEERRPFFKEGTSLFNTGKLFYSRRIGRTPTLFYDVLDSLESGEELIRNPTAARLVNATKLSGRTNDGLGIGLMNAVTGNTYAEIRKADGNTRSVLTEPLTNYTVLVLDQQLKNNSNVWMANTGTIRDGQNRDANVFSTGTLLENKKHSIRLTTRYANSRVWEWQDENNEYQKTLKNGHQFSTVLEKISGKWQYGGVAEFGDRNFDKNDLGFIFINDYSTANIFGSYNLFNPFWKIFRQGSIDAWINRDGRWSRDNELTSLAAGNNVFLLFNNMWSYFHSVGTNLKTGRDWFEPRVNGRYYEVPKNTWMLFSFSSNYNKPLAFDWGFNHNWSHEIGQRSFGYFINPMIRFNDHFSLKFNNEYELNTNARGFCTFDTTGAPVFGRRDVKTLTNMLIARYQFNPNMSLSLNVRHYWSQGDYDQYYNLEDDGTVTDYQLADPNTDPFNGDFNSNFFNVDLVYNWVFAPGSSFLVTYKNSISSEDDDVSIPYFRNLENVLQDPQTNSIAIKILYFLDYERLTTRRTR